MPPQPADLAYVIYTSGSTGRPKGVLVDHGALARFTLAAIATYGFGPQDRILQFTSLSFDVSVEEIFGCLAAGASLVLRDDAMLSSPARFFAVCDEWGITVLDLPTAYWHTLAAEVEKGHLAVPPALRMIITGGERALPERVAGWLAAVGAQPRLFHTYGPTEGTVMSVAGALGQPGDPLVGATAVPLGRPWGGTRLWLLDPWLNPVPAGVAGNLHLSGGPLARGYLGRPDLTAAAFVPCPFGAAGDRLYRTGDLFRYRGDGVLEFAGRVDDQVKIRGFRVEPGEIAAVLAGHPAVRHAVVLAPEAAAGERRLIAYAAFGDGTAPAAAVLREFLKERLPAYMVPTDYVCLPELPLTVTGKLDVAALPAAQERAPEEYAPPESETEELLAEVWRDILGRERVGLYDNLFDLGAHSLLLPHLLAKIEDACGVELPLRSLFEAPTVAQLAVVVDTVLLARIESLSDDEVAAMLVGT